VTSLTAKNSCVKVVGGGSPDVGAFSILIPIQCFSALTNKNISRADE
jgi:hypothetical protein